MENVLIIPKVAAIIDSSIVYLIRSKNAERHALPARTPISAAANAKSIPSKTSH
ncbi:MAG: hypothetical protein ACI4WX_11575 [Aristaeellaceae bacterium]